MWTSRDYTICLVIEFIFCRVNDVFFKSYALSDYPTKIRLGALSSIFKNYELLTFRCQCEPVIYCRISIDWST